MRDGQKQGRDCLAPLASDVASRLETINPEQVELLCVDAPGDTACAWTTGGRSNSITINTAEVAPSRSMACGIEPAAVALHEMLHFTEGSHKNGTGRMDPSDLIYACVAACFGDVHYPGGISSACQNCGRASVGVGACEAKVACKACGGLGCLVCGGQSRCQEPVRTWTCRTCYGKPAFVLQGEDCGCYKVQCAKDQVFETFADQRACIERMEELTDRGIRCLDAANGCQPCK